MGMHAIPGMDGHCGNFNGNPGDDTRPMVRSRLGTTGVPPAELLFASKTAVVTANRPDINNRDPDKLTGAKPPARQKSTSSSPRCRALLMSASEATRSLRRTRTCEAAFGSAAAFHAQTVRAALPIFPASLVPKRHEMHGAPAGTAFWVAQRGVCSESVLSSPTAGL